MVDPGQDLTFIRPNRDAGSLYSPAVGLVYLFNLIVGTGALTMPRAFATAGWLVSLIMVTFLAIISYITATFVIESMASVNGIRKWMRLNEERKMTGEVPLTDTRGGVEVTANNSLDETHEIEGEGERKSLLSDSGHTYGSQRDFSSIFEITETIEMGQMAKLFFNKVGLNLFYIVIIIYLYGDLAIYAAAVPKSLRDVACTYMEAERSTNGTPCSQNLTEGDLCWNTSSLTRMDAYRIFVAAFALLLGPFVYFNLQKTKHMQILTTVLRWVAFIMMIVLAVIQLARGKGQGKPPVANLGGIPNLFGVCVYAFMCHHSLPQMVTPIRSKSGIYRLFAGDYFLILVFYCLLSFTGIYCFGQIDDLYTLNFKPNRCDGDGSVRVTDVAFIEYFLALFPVFTLSASFPIIAITLRNNLKVLFGRWTPFPWAVDRLVFPTVTVAVPVAIALGTNDVQILVGVTGSYAGAGIQYVVPACFALLARRRVAEIVGDDATNEFKSPFRHTGWIVLVFVWSVVCIAFVTANHIIGLM